MPAPSADIRQLHERLGRLSPPVDVHALPTHGFVVAFRVPLTAGARLLPEGMRMRELGRSGHGILCACGGEFRGARVGKLSIPAPSHQDYHCRVLVEHTAEGRVVPAGHTLLYEASSRLVELCSGNLSELRRPPARFERAGGDESSSPEPARWSLRCTSKEPLCCMSFETQARTTSWSAPATTAFGSLRAASEFLLDLDGYLVHDFAREKTHFRAREPRDHDVAFCTDFSFDFPLIRHLDEAFELGLELDCALFVGGKRPARVLSPELRAASPAGGEASQLPAGAG